MELFSQEQLETIKLLAKQQGQQYGRGKDYDYKAVMLDIAQGFKVCSICSIRKPLAEFHKKSNSPNGYKAECGTCAKARWQDWADKNRETLRESDRRRHYQREYGLSKPEAGQLVESRQGTCQICKTNCQIVIDHNHATGQIRGLLCSKCNSILGFAADRVEILEAAIQYLKETDCG